MGEEKYLIVWHDQSTESKVAADLLPFFEEMVKEVARHYPKQGDSWKTARVSHLNNLLLKSMKEYQEKGFIENPDHLIDIADFAAFLWMSLKTLRAWGSLKGPGVMRE